LSNIYEPKTDQELVEFAAGHAGAAGAGALAEMQRRLMVSINELLDVQLKAVTAQQEATASSDRVVKLTKALLWLTGGLGFVAIVQTIVAVAS
jgi:hypothetical protein